jgi:chromosome segregation ATPase
MQMKAAVLAATAVSAAGDATNPIAKVLQMIDDLAGKVIKEGEASHKVYAEFAEFCEDRHQEIGFEIKTGTSESEELAAAIAEATSEIDAAASQIEELGASVAEDEKDLKAATEVRGKENADFVAVEKDLSETIDMLERAIAVIEREMAGGAAFAQIKGANGLVQALQSMVAAEQMSVADGKKLAALVQTENDQRDQEAAFGAPAAAVYESSSGGIVDTLQGLLDTATEQLDSARKAETQAKNNYDMKKQSLEDEIKYATADLDEAKKTSAANEEKKATAEGDLAVTTKALNEDKADLASLHHDCMTKASAYETEVSSRGEELKALATAKKIVVEATSLAQTDSFVQLASSTKGNKVVHILKKLANSQSSTALSQLASRVQSAIRLGSSAGEDPFAKVKELISDMLAKLTKEAEEDATQKAFCDKEMKETKAKKEEKTAEVEKLSTKKEQKEAQSTKLKEEVATLQKELAEIASTQAEMDSLRSEEKANYEVTKPELEKAVAGIQAALKVLKDYYAKAASHGASEGAGGGIISLLEVAEADFSKNLSEVVAEEQTAAAAYESQTKENGMTKLTKEQDVKYKTKEAASLDKAVSELTTDLEGVQDELDAVNAAWKTITAQCVAKPETYEERKARREAEINGLKDALEVLESETAFVQVSAKHLRGVRKHA